MISETMKKKNTILFLAAALLLQACGHSEKNALKTLEDDVIPVEVMSIAKTAEGQTVSVSGQFSTDDETIMSFKTGGIVSKMYVKEGDKIRKGQLLAALDLTEIKSMVNQAKMAYEKAERDLKRVTSLNKDGFATLEQMQNAQTGFNVAQDQYQSAQFNLKYSEIRAISDGYVLRKMVNTGQLVASGTPIFQTNGAGNSTWLLKAGIGDVEWNSVQIGDVAVIKSDVLNGRKLHGKVVRKSEGTDPYTGSFSIEIAIDKNEKAKLASGMFGTADIQASAQSQLWSIPYDAILDGNANEGFVFVTDDNQTAKKVTIRIASIEQKNVLVSSGLEGHNTLIVSGNAYLTDGSKIKIADRH